MGYVTIFLVENDSLHILIKYIILQIRISLKSVDDKKCVRSYRPSTLQPGTTTTIVVTIAIDENHREGSLLYLPSSISVSRDKYSFNYINYSVILYSCSIPG